MEPASALSGAVHAAMSYLGSSAPQNMAKDTQFQPLTGVCEFLNALHVYTEEARQGVTRFVEANHFCSHQSKTVRQCLIYDSNSKDARLIGVEYMIPKRVYETLPDEEKSLWHSHEFEVKSGMLVLPKPSYVTQDEWELAERQAMKEVVGLYGKTWHFWQIDRGDELPLGYPKLMGSLTDHIQVDLDLALAERDMKFGVNYKDKAKSRETIACPGVHPLADSWWQKT
ncbi:hypothetical protein BZG36_00726 [Bifiguratus adelaidae]|uniref:DUF1264 domain-containing protein n=1 Tax=Bifiguratus adelaidae TaxID=1938954 RepID=A0A261Y6U1_9FUNG|nr:hypothetical protein BZG36_00726 [Bifiguratus adelaidae]